MKVCLRNRNGFRALLAIGLAALGTVQKASAQDAPETCEHLTSGADEHTCQHGFLGPFASVGSTPHPGDAPTTNVSTTHVLYTVALSGDSGSNQSAVLFEPSTSGTYALYANEAYPLGLFDSEGQAVPIRLENDVPACSQYLGWFRVYEDLKADRTYTVVLGPSEDVFVQVVVETLAVFRDTLYLDNDGDGFGFASESVKSWCGVASGYSEVSDDCDDNNERVFPGSDESCNGIDDDCDSEIDEEGDSLCEGKSSCGGDDGCVALTKRDCDDDDCGAPPGKEELSPASGNGGSRVVNVGSGGSSNEVSKNGHAGSSLGGNGGDDSRGSPANPDPQNPQQAIPSSGDAEVGCSCRLHLSPRPAGPAPLVAASLLILTLSRRLKGSIQGRTPGSRS